MPGYGQIDHDDGIRLATTPPEADGPVWMVNLMSYRKQAAYADGRDTALTGREADDEYTPLEPLAVVRYPTRAAFIAMQDVRAGINRLSASVGDG